MVLGQPIEVAAAVSGEQYVPGGVMPRQLCDVGSISVFPEKLETAQQLLLDTVWQGYQRAGQWPVYSYVEAMLDQHDLDAE